MEFFWQDLCLSELFVCRETVVIHYYTNSEKKKKTGSELEELMLFYRHDKIVWNFLAGLALVRAICMQRDSGYTFLYKQ